MSGAGAKRWSLLGLCAFFTLLFTALGVWQVERLHWKLDLIRRVDQQVAAAPIAPPGPAGWSKLDSKALEYRHARLTGVFDHANETLVDALTERGAGYWVVTPLRNSTGTYLVNRGFVPKESASASQRVAGQVRGDVTVTGLLRASEPGGRFLRPNKPAEDRWYSRDVAAISKRRNVGHVAPFFIDADASPNPGGLPIGGLTVVRFRNAHLVYALTWFSLAALSLTGLVLVWKAKQKTR